MCPMPTPKLQLTMTHSARAEGQPHFADVHCRMWITFVTLSDRAYLLMHIASFRYDLSR